MQLARLRLRLRLRLTDMLFRLAVKSFLWFVSFSFTTNQRGANFKEELRVAYLYLSGQLDACLRKLPSTSEGAQM